MLVESRQPEFKNRIVATSFVAIWLFAFSIPMGQLRAQVASTTLAAPERMRVEETPDGGWEIFVGNAPFAGYVVDSGGKPIVYPIRGPGGHAMTRNFPMKKDYGLESGDHDHHRSMWLSHGDVNGVDFWLDDQGCGKVVQRKGDAEVTNKGSVVLTTENDWMGPDGKRILSDVRRYEFVSQDRRRIIDCDFLLKASDGDVHFGDTKEGTFGMRVAASLNVDAKKGGMITNADLETNKNAWGKRSPWVDYSGPVDDEMVGITIHNHPSSFGFPTRWHVRTYGLFAANPFGRSDFTRSKKQRPITLLKGKSIRLNYRVVIYQDTFEPEVAKADSEAYHNGARPDLE
ncbi:MAG: PmoA family protein [Pirellulaceae bacterium]